MKFQRLVIVPWRYRCRDQQESERAKAQRDGARDPALAAHEATMAGGELVEFVELEHPGLLAGCVTGPNFKRRGARLACGRLQRERTVDLLPD